MFLQGSVRQNVLIGITEFLEKAKIESLELTALSLRASYPGLIDLIRPTIMDTKGHSELSFSFPL